MKKVVVLAGFIFVICCNLRAQDVGELGGEGSSELVMQFRQIAELQGHGWDILVVSRFSGVKVEPGGTPDNDPHHQQR